MDVTLTLSDLLDSFERYNLALRPMPVIAYGLGLLALWTVIRRPPNADRIVLAVLAFFWLATAVGFFLLTFSAVYTPAYLFAAVFALQGVAYLRALRRPPVTFALRADGYGVVGALFILYALIGYPVAGTLLGHTYPQTPAFGLTPCPLVVFTFGLYLFTQQRVPSLWLVIALLWALGGVLPVSVGIWEDVGLIVSGVLGSVLLLLRDRRATDAPATGAAVGGHG